MPRFLVWSDLHCEHTPFQAPTLAELGFTPDALLVAGDTDKYGRHIDAYATWAQRYGCPVIAIDGNHEGFFLTLEDMEEAADAQAATLRGRGVDVRMLRGGATEVAGVRIVGATLWTDFALYGDTKGSMQIASDEVNDHKRIRLRNGPFDPQASSARHARERAAVLEHLRQPFDGPTVVMTHHMPRPELNTKEFAGHPRTPAFASDMRRDLEGLTFAAWIYGHTHACDHGGVWRDPEGRRYVFNARGDRDPNPGFNPTFMIEV